MRRAINRSYRETGKKEHRKKGKKWKKKTNPETQTLAIGEEIKREKKVSASGKNTVGGGNGARWQKEKLAKNPSARDTWRKSDKLVIEVS